MFTQFFGQFLLNNTLVTPEQLQIVFHKVKNTRLRLGMVAINEGYLSANQVEEINDLQRKHDKRFGEIAVEFNYITDGQLHTILNKQPSEHLLLAQAILDLDYMTMEEFQESIEVYKRLHGISNDSFDELKDGKIEHVIFSLLDIDNENIKDFVVLFYKNILRFITPDVYISESFKVIKGQVYKHLFEQSITGDFKLYTGFSAADHVLIPFASQYASESLDSVDDYTLDVCKEFLNLHNGLYTVNMSNQGHILNLKIQAHREDATVESDIAYCVPFHTAFGDIDLIIG